MGETRGYLRWIEVPLALRISGRESWSRDLYFKMPQMGCGRIQPSGISITGLGHWGIGNW